MMGVPHTVVAVHTTFADCTSREDSDHCTSKQCHSKGDATCFSGVYVVRKVGGTITELGIISTNTGNCHLSLLSSLQHQMHTYRAATHPAIGS
jgi:hypothetical protein